MVATVAAGLGLAVKAADADVYTVKSGDTLNNISATYSTKTSNDVSVDAIVKANDIKDSNLIYVGEQLTINTDTAVKATTPAASTNTTSEAVAPAATTPAPAKKAVAPAAATTSDSSSAKAWIANKESGGSYTATNGQYIGKYQLSSSYLNGDYSAANQEKVANNYVSSRYGSWEAAKSFWLSNGWY
ncbi:LysM peptidoglycan-binding domain-containing protein [Dellaglioa algida]|nr:LysM domain-containing protein [Dellaglioa algida]MDK1728450.1 LysM peptidoglycan-binding domain-containing protein [Dellaglioa algida]MDK1736146.1 LysM peptidoglycan-binding domain-containing protein [Dellaglioa algida]MDK1737815.1 LysM peptidoglycan-binding domain-containing protein [Dellaglioa algida]